MLLRSHRARLFVTGATGAVLALGLATSANAATASWTCGADAVKATVAGLEPINPVTASRTPCGEQFTGLPNTTDSLGLAPTINAKTAYAITAAKPVPGRPIEQTVAAAAGTEGLSIKSGDTVIIGVDAAKSEVQASCANGQPKFLSSGDVVGLTVGGQKVSLDNPLIQLTDALSSILGAVVEIKLNEQVKDSSGFIQRAAHIKVLKAAGAAPLIDVIVAESRVSSASACDPNADGNGGGTGGNGGGTGGNGGGTGGNGGGTTGGSSTGGSSSLKLCPDGSVLNASSGYCVIPASASGGQGVIVIGRPYTGPSGGTVVALNVARKKYKSPCLTQKAGPKYAIVGTNKANRITGTNGSDRVLGLGGNDALDGGRGNDCLDGGTGGDTLSGALGADKAYGGKGRDHLNGGPGSDYLSGGADHDTISTSSGADRAFGGAGADFINAAQAGTPARISCGTGRDKVRINKNERKRIRGCETVYVFNDR